MRLDLHWWHELLPKWNGISLILKERAVRHMWTDASGSRGQGAFFTNPGVDRRLVSWEHAFSKPLLPPSKQRHKTLRNAYHAPCRAAMAPALQAPPASHLHRQYDGRSALRRPRQRPFSSPRRRSTRPSAWSRIDAAESQRPARPGPGFAASPPGTGYRQQLHANSNQLSSRSLCSTRPS